MRILDTARQQYAVYWAPTGRDDFGHWEYSEPRELRVRWDETTETVAKGNGQQQTSRAKVMVGETLVEGGVLMRTGNEGRDQNVIAGMTTEQKADPFTNPGAWEIMRFDATPLIKVRSTDDYYRVAWL